MKLEFNTENGKLYIESSEICYILECTFNNKTNKRDGPPMIVLKDSRRNIGGMLILSDSYLEAKKKWADAK